MHLKVTVCKDVQDAIDKGYDYAARGDFSGIHLKEVVIVHGGMASGLPSVDLILEDNDGNKYVAVTSAAMLKVLPL